MICSSPCIDKMMQMRSEFCSSLEFEFESSKDHSSKVIPMTDDSEVVAHDVDSSIGQGILAGERLNIHLLGSIHIVCEAKTNSKQQDKHLFKILLSKWWHHFFHYRESNWKVGSKIVEGD
jgi:hypothetical protein